MLTEKKQSEPHAPQGLSPGQVGKLDIQNRVNTLDYVIRMLGELRNMSHGVDDGTLAYFIEMAAIEGHDQRERLERKLKDNC